MVTGAAPRPGRACETSAMQAWTIHDAPLAYADLLPQREAGAVDLLVVHCTELPDLATARQYGERVRYGDGTGNSGHYTIDRDGTTYQDVPPTRVAQHVRGHNAHSVGVELVNAGRYPDWWDSRHQEMTEPYPAAQIEALLRLIDALRRELPNLRGIAGHEDLDRDFMPASDDPARQVRRKLDPGRMFPWAQVLYACGLPRAATP